MSNKNKEALDALDLILGELQNKLSPDAYLRYLDLTRLIRAALSSPTASDYEEVLADHRRLVRELDVILNGEDGAAKQASLCDIVSQVKHQKLPAVPVIEGLDEAIEYLEDTDDRGYLVDKYISTLIKASRAYAALPKLQKVDLDAEKCNTYADKEHIQSIANTAYNSAIDDIKAKYGELYAEVKE